MVHMSMWVEGRGSSKYLQLCVHVLLFWFVKPEPCEDEDLEAEADGPDMEPGTEMDQGELSL